MIKLYNRRNRSCRRGVFYAYDKIGFLIFYPLIFIENKFYSLPPDFHKVAIPDRMAINWLLKEMIKRNCNKKLPFKFNEDEYYEFLRVYPKILSMYLDFEKNLNIKLMRTIAKPKIIELEGGLYELQEAEISDDYLKDNIYYYGLDDSSARQDELKTIMEPDKYLLSNYNYFDDFFKMKFSALKDKIKLIKGLMKNVDKDLYKLCIERVSVDINKLGNDFNSNVVSNNNELKSVLGFFYYMCRVCIYGVNLLSFLHEDILKDLVVCVDYYKLVKQINEITELPTSVIKKYLSYFNLEGEIGGGVNEFPIILYNNKVIFIPTSFMLNDYQFSIVNAHYHKGINIIDRDKTVSKSIVDDIIKKADKFSNIISVSNKEYFDNEHKFKGKELVSDIDTALYDKLSNTLLVIECKWKENVYPLNEDFIKIERAVNEVFNGQLDKHKEFLELSEDNIDYIFSNNSVVKSRSNRPNTFYIFVDKRIQFHSGFRHTLSVFMLLHLFDEFSNNNILFLDKVCEEIMSLQTEVTYLPIKHNKTLKIDDITINQDMFTLDYTI